MTYQLLPLVLYIIPLTVLLTALTPPRFRYIPLALGGLGYVQYAGGRAASACMLLTVCIGWFAMRMQHTDQADRKARYWLWLGIAAQAVWLLPAKLLTEPAVMIPLLLCNMQGIEYLAAYANGQMQLPSLARHFGDLCAMPRLLAGLLPTYDEAAGIRAARRVTAERFGKGAELCIKGLFELVLLSLPMQMLHTQLKTAETVFSAMDAWIVLAVYYFAVWYALRGAVGIGRGIAQMLGYAVPELPPAALPALSMREYFRQSMPSAAAWVQRVLLRDIAAADIGAYSARMLLLGGGVGFLLGKGVCGLLWGVVLALLLTAEYTLNPDWVRQFPALLRRTLTAVLLLLTLGILRADTMTACFSFYGSLLGKNGVSPSSTVLYLCGTHFLPLLICAAGVFPIRALLQKRIALRGLPAVVCRVCKPLADAAVLLLCMAELMSRWLRP